MSELNRYLDDRPDAKVFRLHGDAFTDTELLDLEFRFIFEKTWIFLAFEFSIAKPNDYVTARVMGISPAGCVRGNTQMGSEVRLRSCWREWRRLMRAGLSGSNGY